MGVSNFCRKNKMPDISMCNTQHCELSKKCYRHEDSGTEPNGKYQSWGCFQKNHDTGKDCPYFWTRDKKRK